MATWAIGDLHGCYGDLERLLTAIGFEPGRDRLWFTGDLVNRGPDSLACLRFVRDLGDRAICVPGNHDLHLLAAATGVRASRPRDTFEAILRAPDREALLDWLRFLPLLHHDPALGFTLVHAGLHPAWDLATARTLAGEVETELRRDDYPRLLESMYGNEPRHWSPALAGAQRTRFAINVFTRMRYCHADGALDLTPTGPPGTQPAGRMPWFEVPGRAHAGPRIVFGHWSTLGYHAGEGVHALDSGCLWGGRLTALSLDDPRTVVQVECAGELEPGY